MNPCSKLRIQMGCGEPLQSRWWVAQPTCPELESGQQARAQRKHGKRASGRRGAKYKS